MAVDAVTQAGVQETLEKFRRGYEAKDMDLMVDCFAEDDVSIFGTAADEKRIGLVFAQPSLDALAGRLRFNLERARFSPCS